METPIIVDMNINTISSLELAKNKEKCVNFGTFGIAYITNLICKDPTAVTSEEFNILKK